MAVVTLGPRYATYPCRSCLCCLLIKDGLDLAWAPVRVVPSWIRFSHRSRDPIASPRLPRLVDGVTSATAWAQMDAPVGTESGQGCRPCPVTLMFIVFSKDRPGQLRQLLSSARLCLAGERLRIMTHILYKCTEEATSNAYLRVAEEFDMEESEVEWTTHFVAEDNFAEQLLGLLAADGEGHAPSAAAPHGADFVMFGVDDMLFYARLDLARVLTCLTGETAAMAFHPRLHPYVSFSQTSDQACPPPRFSQPAQLTALMDEAQLYVFDWTSAVADWSYPWDLCGGTYRLNDARMVVQHIVDRFGSDGIANPNKLEERGNRVCRELFREEHGDRRARSLALCPSAPSLSVISVNAVQDTYDVPTCQMTFHYRSEHSKLVRTVDQSENVLSPSLKPFNDLLLLPHWFFDLKHYNHKAQLGKFDSVHIGLVALTSQDDDATLQSIAEQHLGVRLIALETASRKPKQAEGCEVSVILPARNCADYVEAAISSIVNSIGVSMEILILLDHSTDDTHEVVHASIQNLPNAVAIRVLDVTGDVELDDPHRLPKILNLGIQAARGEFVARMDADDILHPHRLHEQVQYLRAMPHLDCIGCAVRMFSSETAVSGDRRCDTWERHTRAASTLALQVYECNHLLVPWRCLFGSVVAHPATMMRKSALVRAGCYTEVSAEDYALWARMIFGEGRPFMPCVANLPSVRLLYRKHAASVTSQAPPDAKAESRTAISAAAMSSLLSHYGVNSDTVSDRAAHIIIECAEEGASVDEAVEASRVLRALEAAYMRYLSELQGDAEDPESCRRAMKAVRIDVSNRLGAIASHAVASHSSEKALSLLMAWVQRERTSSK